MSPNNDPAPRGSTSLIALLLCALVIAGVLAYQAQDAARSHRQTAERTLAEYAGVASEQFAYHAQMALTAMQMMSLREVVMLEGSPDAGRLPSAEEFGRSARSLASWCGCLDEGVTFFRLDHRDGVLTTAGAAPLAVPVWSEELRWTGPTSDPEDPFFGQAPIGETQNAFITFADRRADVIVGDVEGRPRLMLFYQLQDEADRPIAVYGYEGVPEEIAGPLFRRVLRNTPLLPRSLIGDLPNDSLLAITVSGPDGREIFSSGTAPSSEFVASDTLPPPWDEMVVHASLRPEIAANLIIGGLPSSRLPLLLALLGLTAALIVGTLVQLHRHHELVRARSRFVAGVSHELRTPLTQIRLYAELLRSGRLDAEDRERSVRVIDQEARRLSHLVENVLSFSRSGRAAERGRAEPRALAPLVREIIEDFEPLARARQVEVRPELDPAVRAAVEPDVFRQMLLNLLDNAVKYGPAGQVVAVGLEQRGGEARLWVEDEGMGIPEAERERVWEPYRRLDAAVDSGMGGSGIGLSVVREIATLHGGRAWVSEAEGRGARLVIALPALPAGARPDREMEAV